MNNSTIDQYQKGYADGYRRHKQQSETEKSIKHDYLVYVCIITILFFLLMISIVYIITIKANKQEH